MDAEDVINNWSDFSSGESEFSDDDSADSSSESSGEVEEDNEPWHKVSGKIF